MMQPLIDLKDIWMKYQSKDVLTGVSLQVHPGEIVTLIGPNGAGKTTLVRIALGLQEPSAGQRTLQKGLRIGYMPQKLHINQMMPLTVDRFLQLTGCRLTAIKDALAKTGVVHLLNSPMQSLSGGEMQRVLLARALLHKPHLLVLDEPVQGVDITGQRELYKLINDIREEPREKKRCAVFMVSHDLHLVMASTDRVVCVNQHVCCSGHPQQVREHPAYQRLFGIMPDELAVYEHHHDHQHDINGQITSCGHSHPEGNNNV
ncbi:zinc ABC transporter ATP-binding protein ZnuC [Endozoicomonas ascidiicola]|uniref:zinc ABC transporter ATP-binding protein ZnuC n=1 Tax=Endozoicomonas ascidiicola TaxID=1698521 RepID=UPI000836184D|nr:zinc ABC transporter ATP-binding protein ZnuC [Endozoicomonas ascidiicola]